MPGCRVTVMVRSGARDVEIQSQAFSGVRSAKYLVSMSSGVPRTSNKWPRLVDDLHRRVAERERRPRRDVGVFVAHRSITTSGRPGARGPPPTGPARVAGARHARVGVPGASDGMDQSVGRRRRPHTQLKATPETPCTRRGPSGAGGPGPRLARAFQHSSLIWGQHFHRVWPREVRVPRVWPSSGLR